MKLRIELAKDMDEDEVIIRCRSVSEEVKLLQNLIKGALPVHRKQSILCTSE